MVPGCGRPSLGALAKGFAAFHCRYHVEHRARHGSHWHSTYKAAELKPYVVAAEAWLKAQGDTQMVEASLRELRWQLAFAGNVIPFDRLRGLPASARARAAFARLREREVPAERLAAIYLGVNALVADDWQSHRSAEFIRVQAAKAVHRLASGTHREWKLWRTDTRYDVLREHRYPRSSGLVLRKIGDTLAAACRALEGASTAAIIAAVSEKRGPHPSHPWTASNQVAIRATD